MLLFFQLSHKTCRVIFKMKSCYHIFTDEINDKGGPELRYFPLISILT